MTTGDPLSERLTLKDGWLMGRQSITQQQPSILLDATDPVQQAPPPGFHQEEESRLKMLRMGPIV